MILWRRKPIPLRLEWCTDQVCRRNAANQKKTPASQRSLRLSRVVLWSNSSGRKRKGRCENPTLFKATEEVENRHLLPRESRRGSTIFKARVHRFPIQYLASWSRDLVLNLATYEFIH